MGVVHPGPKNPNWKGGRTVKSDGYVLIRVGKGHHLADVRGYAYEHRVVAEQKLGRRLAPGEQVHHVDGNRQNNAPENLEVLSIAEHAAHHNPRADSRAIKSPYKATRPAQRLSPDDVVTIRRAYASGQVTLADLADQYGGGIQRISRLVRGQRAAGAGGPISTNNHRGIERREPQTGRISAARTQEET